ncbi:TRAP transporter large permease [Rhodospirillaceae bacterium KN72]|uniref:TRAP transporter large permease protein n=1 Tax=Pacificispira spongiicola TaxID=2729598 RepID=A0A7Y0HCX0_9PROT|nr:TRAP transporter large permease [Pacificispira spongiicola]NMM43040.1 TRAP transporter large permease [Pacificispira spongiicola]
MDWGLSLTLLIGGMVLLMAFGLPVAFAFLGINLLGAFIFLGGEAGLEQVARNTVAALSNFSLAPIPLFLLMGEILFHTGVAFRAIDAIDRLITKVPGRLSIVAVGGGIVFSSLSGSTIANTAVLGSALLPDMLKRGYHPTIAMGPIMATGSIAMLIPPSALAVLLGSLAGMSISQLLIAGIVPGFLMGAAFLLYIIVRCRLNPSLAPSYEVEAMPFWDRVKPSLVYVVPLFTIFVVVVGSILAGWATPTESAALGSVAAFLACLAYGRVTVKNMMVSLLETAKISVMVLFIIGASLTFSQILAFSGAADGLLGWIQGFDLSSFALLLAMLVVLLFLGCFMDQVSMILITLPFFIPLAQAAGFDMIWFGVLMLVVMEISFTTPPFGMLLYVMKGVAPPGITIGDVYRSTYPFILLELIVLALIVLVPELATGLPDWIRR